MMEDIADDALRGVDAIARFRGEPKHRTQYLLRRKRITAGKEGRIWTASKRRLRADHEKVTSGEVA